MSWNISPRNKPKMIFKLCNVDLLWRSRVTSCWWKISDSCRTLSTQHGVFPLEIHMYCFKSPMLSILSISDILLYFYCCPTTTKVSSSINLTIWWDPSTVYLSQYFSCVWTYGCLSRFCKSISSSLAILRP